MRKNKSLADMVRTILSVAREDAQRKAWDPGNPPLCPKCKTAPRARHPRRAQWKSYCVACHCTVSREDYLRHGAARRERKARA